MNKNKAFNIRAHKTEIQKTICNMYIYNMYISTGQKKKHNHKISTDNFTYIIQKMRLFWLWISSLIAIKVP